MFQMTKGSWDESGVPGHFFQGRMQINQGHYHNLINSIRLSQKNLRQGRLTEIWYIGAHL